MEKREPYGASPDARPGEYGSGGRGRSCSLGFAQNEPETPSPSSSIFLQILDVSVDAELLLA